MAKKDDDMLAGTSELELEDDLSEEDAQRSQIAKRLALGFVVIVVLLGILFLSEYLAQEEPLSPPKEAPSKLEPAEPKVIGQSVSGPVTPAEPEPPKAPEPESAPVSPKVEEPPPPPVVTQQPEPKSESKPSQRITPRAPGQQHATPVPTPRTAPSIPVQRSPITRAEVAPPQPLRQTPTPPASPKLLSSYSLQAGVFASTEKAQEVHAMLTLNGIPSTLETRVRVGPFANKAEADAARAKLKSLGVESLMLPPKK